MKTVQGIKVKTIDGKDTTLAEYSGKVALVVNVASKCGLTPQYEGLEKLYEKYSGQGFTVLGFPANEFLAQEPGTNAEIMDFCQSKYDVKFPMFSKVVVKGEGQHPLYKALTETKPKAQKNADSGLEKKLESIGQPRKNPADILWNFEKFLLNRKGEVIERFNPDVKPDDPMIVTAIEKQLKD